jgi:hypothetical protein
VRPPVLLALWVSIGLGGCGKGLPSNSDMGACTPMTCMALGKNCGELDDGCGHVITCGTCQAPETCGGGGTAKVCGCTPKTACDPIKDCGTISDGCGGTLDCGTCNEMLTANPISLVVGTASTLLVTVLKGNLSEPVSLTTTGTGNTLTPPTGQTNAGGIFSATLSSTVAETKTVTATIGAVQRTAMVTFTPAAPSLVTSTIEASAVSVYTLPVTLTVTVKDMYGNPVANQAVSLSVTNVGLPGIVSLQPASGPTDGMGVFHSVMKATRSGVFTVAADLGAGVPKSQSVTFPQGGCKTEEACQGGCDVSSASCYSECISSTKVASRNLFDMVQGCAMSYCACGTRGVAVDGGTTTCQQVSGNDAGTFFYKCAVDANGALTELNGSTVLSGACGKCITDVQSPVMQLSNYVCNDPTDCDAGKTTGYCGSSVTACLNDAP